MKNLLVIVTLAIGIFLGILFARSWDSQDHQSLSPQDREKIIAFLKENVPEYHEEYLEHSDEELLLQAENVMEEWQRLASIDPDAAEAFITMLRIESRGTRLADEIVETPNSEKTEALKVIIGEYILARTRFEEGNLKLLKKEIDLIELRIVKDRADIDKVINIELETILRESRRDILGE